MRPYKRKLETFPFLFKKYFTYLKLCACVCMSWYMRVSTVPMGEVVGAEEAV